MPTGETAEELEKRLKKLTDIATLERELNKLSFERLETMKAARGFSADQADALQRQSVERRQAVIDAENELVNARLHHEEARGFFRDRAEADEAQSDQWDAEEEWLKKRRKAGDLNKKELEEELENLEKRKKLFEETKEAAEGLSKQLESAFSADYSKDFVGTMSTIGKQLAKVGDISRLMAGGFMAIGVSAINNMVGLVLKLYDAENAFQKATGASAEFASSIQGVYEDTRATGASVEEVSAAMTSLYGTYTDFTMQNKATREELAETATVLGRLGVSTDDYAKGVQNATKMLGVSADMADDTMRELTAHAKDLGVAPQKMMQDFAGAGGALAKFGDQGVKAFKDMQYASKITGMEMDKILGIANKFDTFEDAAGMAGKLNAALGGNFVNAMDMMMETDPAARFNNIRDSILDAGLSFDDMSYYQKQFYTESLGLSDVGDLAMMLSGNMDGLTGDIGKTSDELVSMKEQAAAVQSLSEQWNAVLAESVVILGPLIDLLRSLMGFLSEHPIVMKLAISAGISYVAVSKSIVLWEKIKTMWQGTATAATHAQTFAQRLLTLATSQTALKFAIFAAGIGLVYFLLFKKKSSPTFYDGIGLMAVAFLGFGFAVKLAGNAMRNATRPMLAAGAAMIMLGGGIALAAEGLAHLVKAFKGLGDSAKYAAMALGILMIPFVAFMGVMAILVYTGVGEVGALIILAMGAAMLMLGAGIAIAAVGAAYLIKAFEGMGFAAIGAAFALYILMTPFIAFMALMAVLVYSGVGEIAALIFLAMGASVLMLGVGMGIAAVGLALLVLGFKELFTVMPIGDFAIFAAILVGLYLAFGIIGILAPFAAAGMLLFAYGMLAIGLALMTLIPTMLVFTLFTGSILALVEQASGLAQIAEEFANIGKAINDIPAVKTTVLTTLMTATAGASVAAATAGAVSGVVTNALGIGAPGPRGAPGAAATAPARDVKVEITLNAPDLQDFLSGKVKTVIGKESGRANRGQ